MLQVPVPILVDNLQKDTIDTLCLFSPSFEPRSVLGISEFINDLDPDNTRIKFGILVFRPSDSRVELLEFLKNSNLAEVELSLSECKHLPMEIYDLHTPGDILDRKLEGIVLNLLAQISEKFNLILDTSSLPREVLIFLMDILQKYKEAGSLKRFVLLYTWAKKYPQLHYPADLGELVTMKTYSPLKTVFERQNRVRAVHAALFVGRQGFDAKQFVEALPDSKVINVHVFMNRENVLHSLEVIRANAPILIESAFNIHYYLTLSSGHEKLIRWAQGCPLEEKTAYLIAPFGPKPLVISAWLAATEIQRRGSKVNGLFTDIVLLREHQYSTTYSLGYKSLCAYEINISQKESDDFKSVSS